jgi:thiol-disulfide isomerase/thioredoxin
LKSFQKYRKKSILLVMEEDLKTEGSKLIRLKNTQEAKKLLSSKAPLMLVVYAKWCGHCQAMFDTWRELSNKVNGKAKVYVIEAAHYKDNDVSGYPDMRIVKKGKAKKYEGGKTVEDLEKGLLHKTLGGSRRRGTLKLRNRVRKTSHRTLRRNISLV